MLSEKPSTECQKIKFDELTKAITELRVISNDRHRRLKEARELINKLRAYVIVPSTEFDVTVNDWLSKED